MGFAGRTGAGKTSAAEHLSSRYGLQYVRYSQILQKWSPSTTRDRDSLRTFGWEVMSGGRQSELNARLIEELDTSRSAAIDGLRHPIDFESLSSKLGPSFRLIFLDARPDVRFERLRSRFATREAFQAAESAPVDRHVDALRGNARLTIPNERRLEDMYERLDEWWASTSEAGDQK